MLIESYGYSDEDIISASSNDWNEFHSFLIGCFGPISIENPLQYRNIVYNYCTINIYTLENNNEKTTSFEIQ